MRILIIGGTGTISTGITRLLLEQNHDVVLFNRGQRTSLVEGNYTTIIGDRKDTEKFANQIQEAGTFDCVIDMYCFLPVDAEHAVQVFKGRTEQYIFCSTVDVYTKPSATYPITEDCERLPPEKFAYGYNKARCEELLFEAHVRGDLSVTSIRPGHTYGEGGNNLLHSLGSGNVILDRLKKEQPIVVHGDGSSFWPTCHRDDVSVAFVGAIANEKAKGRGYHVAGEEWITWEGYHNGLAEAIGAKPPKFVHIPTDVLVQMAPQEASRCDVNFSHNNLYDNTAAREDLGFQVTIPWVEGARRTAQWLTDNNRLENSEDFPVYAQVVQKWQQLIGSI
ncbi:MAG: NAD-dependent epimerase/dehydratase family protein [Candidatus Latescibacteria bacterium]|nr:NAD-dependent epimerase/dehydratase family protein [Candidatus Latescibacterota bacterium]MBT5832660.1 NAD-dependent epimerase/dehydratase family protein [Candidatus Latescibacterota bacterium]